MIDVNFRDIAESIAKNLGDGWIRKDSPRAWRMVLVGPDSQSLFLSNTWSGKGRIYIGGSLPDGVQPDSRNQMPSISVADTKTPKQIANDISRRLLPEYQKRLKAALQRHAEAEAFENNADATRKAVAELIGAPESAIRGEMVYGSGNLGTIQVSSATSIRFRGHCLYVTLDQLKRIKAAVPELFQKTEY